jgi:hypothetical protein
VLWPGYTGHEQNAAGRRNRHSAGNLPNKNLKRSSEMAELFFQHDAMTYFFDTKLLKLYRLEGNQSVEIDNPETRRDGRLNAAEISRDQAFKMAERFRN